MGMAVLQQNFVYKNRERVTVDHGLMFASLFEAFLYLSIFMIILGLTVCFFNCS
jgi:hypothetical protein